MAAAIYLDYGKQGRVWLRLDISETGDVEGAEVLSGDPILAEAAVTAASAL